MGERPCFTLSITDVNQMSQSIRPLTLVKVRRAFAAVLSAFCFRTGSHVQGEVQLRVDMLQLYPGHSEDGQLSPVSGHFPSLIRFGKVSLDRVRGQNFAGDRPISKGVLLIAFVLARWNQATMAGTHFRRGG